MDRVDYSLKKCKAFYEKYGEFLGFNLSNSQNNLLMEYVVVINKSWKVMSTIIVRENLRLINCFIIDQFICRKEVKNIKAFNNLL